MRSIGVVTTSRADYSYYLPLLRAITASPELRLHLMVSGMHLAPEFGLTVQSIERDGFPIAARIEMLLSSDTPAAIAKSMGLGVIGFAQAFVTDHPDILVVLGDRFEMHAATLAALPFNIPVAHIGGGDVTEGAIDECLRHSITKLSHLHFVASDEQERRVLQMGEEPWRVLITGALSLDLIHSMTALSAAETEAKFGDLTGRPFLLVTYHPVTLEHKETVGQVQQLMAALDEVGVPVVFTAPNADTSGRIIADSIQWFVAAHPASRLVANLGTEGYFTAMSLAAAMVGNSSSGIIEAASFKLPVVNIGTRQDGRLRCGNVIDCGYSSQEISAAVRKALSAEFRASLHALTNPFDGGGATARIIERLKTVALDDRLTRKRFVDHRLEGLHRTTI